MTQASRPLTIRPATDAAQSLSSVNVQTGVTLGMALPMLGLIWFGIRAVQNTTLWLSSPSLLVPELVLIGIMMVAASMALIGAPAVARQFKTGVVNHAASAAVQNWVMLAMFSAMTQIAWALMIAQFLNCHG